MKKAAIIFIYLFVLLPALGLAQSSTEDIEDKFFKIYKKDSDEAFDYLFSTNPWLEKNTDATSNVKFKVREASNLMGEYIGYEKILEKEVGESLKVVVILVKYERQPLRFMFQYYKPEKKWRVNNFSFDQDLLDDVEEQLKTEYIK